MGFPFRCQDHCDREFATQLDRIEHKLDALLKGEKIMGEAIDNELTVIEAGQTVIETKLDALSDDEQRELADLEAKDTLTADEQARFDALAARQAATAAAIQADTDAIDAADPATPPVEPAPEGDGGDTAPDAGEGSADAAVASA